MSAFKRSAVSVGTPDMSPPDVGSSIGPISLHNAITTLNLPRTHPYLYICIVQDMSLDRCPRGLRMA
jgi:hypothetical protein